MGKFFIFITLLSLAFSCQNEKKHIKIVKHIIPNNFVGVLVGKMSPKPKDFEIKNDTLVLIYPNGISNSSMQFDIIHYEHEFLYENGKIVKKAHLNSIMYSPQADTVAYYSLIVFKDSLFDPFLIYDSQHILKEFSESNQSKVDYTILSKVNEKDTMITYDIYDLSSEGCEAKCHYSKGKLKIIDAKFYGAGGRFESKLIFSENGDVNVEEWNYKYKKSLQEVKSDSDISLEKHSTYKINSIVGVVDSTQNNENRRFFNDLIGRIPIILKR